jgi:hypothetical protein
MKMLCFGGEKASAPQKIGVLPHRNVIWSVPACVFAKHFITDFELNDILL